MTRAGPGVAEQAPRASRRGRAGEGRAGARRHGVLAAIADFLVEPAEDGRQEAAGDLLGGAGLARPVVAVAGFGGRCGTTVVARALAAELAVRAAEGAAVVTAAGLGSGGMPLGTPAAGRLGRAVQRALPARTRAVGRLCLTCATGDAAVVGALRDIAPLVLDVGDPAAATAAASLADAVVLVAVPATEPALAPVVAESLARVGPEPVVALNRAAGEDGDWERRCVVRLPESRVGAQLALVGREARGELGRAVANLADLVVEGR